VLLWHLLSVTVDVNDIGGRRGTAAT